jgi:hypothetical protein
MCDIGVNYLTFSLALWFLREACSILYFLIWFIVWFIGHCVSKSDFGGGGALPLVFD